MADPVTLTLGATAVLGAGSELMKAQGEAEGYSHREAQARRTAFNARTSADQTDAFLRDELDTTLGNIAAIRSAAGVTLDSPTGLAIEAGQTEKSDRQRLIKVGNLTSQASQSEADAAYFSSAADGAITRGILNAGVRGLGAFRGGR